MRPYSGFGFEDELVLAGFLEELDEDFPGTGLDVDDEPEEPDGPGEAAEPDDAGAEDVLRACE